jgi:hypothetical protein
MGRAIECCFASAMMVLQVVVDEREEGRNDVKECEMTVVRASIT